MARFIKKITAAALLIVPLSAIGDGGVTIRDSHFEAGFESVIRSDRILLCEGGAKLIENQGKRYFIAAGFTSVLDTTPADRLRQLKVARIHAIKAAADFIGKTQVTAEEKFSETTTIKAENNSQNAAKTKFLQETVIIKLNEIIKTPSPVGSWKSSDGKLFFYAIGTMLD